MKTATILILLLVLLTTATACTHTINNTDLTVDDGKGTQEENNTTSIEVETTIATTVPKVKDVELGDMI